MDKMCDGLPLPDAVFETLFQQFQTETKLFIYAETLTKESLIDRLTKDFRLQLQAGELATYILKSSKSGIEHSTIAKLDQICI